MSETRHKIRIALLRLVGGAAVLCLVGGVGCRGPADGGRTATAIVPPPMPQQFSRGTSQATITTERAAGAAVIAPSAIRTGTLSWQGSTNGWIAEISHRLTLSEPWQVVGWVTNQNWWTFPAVAPQGFYAVTKMTDTDNPNNVWTGR